MILETMNDEMEEALNQVVEKIENGIGVEKHEMSQDMFDSLYAFAYHFYQNGKYKEAKSFFRFLTLLNMSEAKYWMGLGASDQMLKNYTQAIDSYKIAMVLNETSPYVYFVIADCYIAQGLIDEALQVLETAEQLFGNQEKYKNLMTHIGIIRQAWIVNYWRIQMDDLILDNTRIKPDPSQHLVYSAKDREQTQEKTISPVSPFAKDTLVSASIAKQEVSKTASVRETLSSAVSWLWGLIYGQSPSSEQPNGRPILEAPTIQDEKARQNFVREITEMQKRILSLDDEYKELLTGNPQNQEALLMKLLTLAIKNQLQLKEDRGLMSTKKVDSHKKDGQTLSKDQKKIKDELGIINNRKEWAKTIDVAVGVTAGALMLATLAATAFAPFVAPLMHISTASLIEGILTVSAAKGGTALAFAKSGTTLLNGYTKGASDEKAKDSYLIQAQQELAKEGVKIGFDEMKQALQDVSTMWSLLRETAERQKQASSAMLK